MAFNKQWFAGLHHKEWPGHVDRIEVQEVILCQRIKIGMVARMFCCTGIVDENVETARLRGCVGQLATALLS